MAEEKMLKSKTSCKKEKKRMADEKMLKSKINNK